MVLILTIFNSIYEKKKIIFNFFLQSPKQIPQFEHLEFLFLKMLPQYFNNIYGLKELSNSCLRLSN